jgi:hypothetical protein
MKKQIRNGVFETNSSSTHSLVICTKAQYEKWKNGELVYISDFYPLPKDEHPNQKFFTPDEAKNFIDKGLDEYYVNTFDDWPRDYEESKHEYTTESGDELVIRAYYGHD